jgi:hypothetical protein
MMKVALQEFFTPHAKLEENRRDSQPDFGHCPRAGKKSLKLRTGKRVPGCY